MCTRTPGARHRKAPQCPLEASEKFWIDYS
jgi:hypothetical protein